MIDFSNHFKAFSPELFMVLCLFILLSYGIIYSTSLSYGRPVIVKNLSWLTIQVFFLSCLLIINNPVELSIFSDSIIIDCFGSSAKIVVLVATISCILVSFRYVKTEKLSYFEYPILIMLSILGIFLIISSYDLITMYLGIELQSLSLYVLASLKKDSAFSTEAGLKYFILGALSSGLILFGCSLIYGFTATTNLSDISYLLFGITGTSGLNFGMIILGLCFVVSGLLFKLAAAPFHMWSPDVYEGAPTSVSAFFAIVPKIAIIVLLIRLLYFSFYDFAEFWNQIIITSSFASMVIGAFGAVQQKKIKRLLAYSSIGHVGYMLVGMATGTLMGIKGLLLYIVIYMITSLGIWSTVLSLEFQNRYGRVKYLTDLTALSKTNPLMAITISLIMFSMAGVPPLAGFFAKMYIFLAAIDSSLYLLAVVAVLTSCVGAYYYMRLIKIMYFEKASTWNAFNTIDREKSLILGLSTTFILLFILMPQPFLLAWHEMAYSICLYD
jgi:NADH-quinone oxidoreductase subunit N